MPANPTASRPGCDRILLVAAVIVLTSAAIALLTIRGKDFVQQGQSPH